MGTRYQVGDKVKISTKGGERKGEVVDIDRPDSDSPSYIIEHESGMKGRARASLMEKVDESLPSKEELAKELKKISGQAGMLFQSHPSLEGWETTRPGAMSGEMFALKNEDLGIRRISMRYFREGEVRPGLGYSKEEASEDQLLDDDQWIIEVMDDTGEIPWSDPGSQQFFYDEDRAYKEMAELILNVTEERE
jgi:hypothetical protein